MSSCQGTAARDLRAGKVQTSAIADGSQAEPAGLEGNFRTDKRGQTGDEILHSDVCVRVCKKGKPTSC